MVSTCSGRRSMSTRHSMVLPLPTSPVTLTMPSSWEIAYSSASSVAPRFAPAKKKSVWGVMRNGGSFSPKWSRYILPVALCRSSFLWGRSLLLLLQRLHARVQRGAVDAQHLGRLADVAAGELHGSLDIALLPGLEHVVQVEIALALQVPLRLLDQRSGVPVQVCPVLDRRLQIELRLDLNGRELLA